MAHLTGTRSSSRCSCSESPTLRDQEHLNNVTNCVSEQQDKTQVEYEKSSPQPEDDVLWVDWDGPDDPMNARNWSNYRKWATTIIAAVFTFISPASSSMIAPANEQITQEFHIKSTVLVSMTTSIFLLGYCVGPLLFGPLSEIYGRSRVLRMSNLWFLAWNTGCGFSRNTNELIVFRFLAGVGGSAPLSLGGSILGDVWPPEKRGRAFAIYSLAPLLGPAIGPICGAWVEELSTWRWVFWSVSIVDVFIQVLGMIFLRETYAPRILDQKAKKIRKTLKECQHKHVQTVFETTDDRSWGAVLSKALVRPSQFLTYEPIVQILGLYMMFVYGIFYLFLTTIPRIFTRVYHETAGISGLNYIALVIGLAIAAQLNGHYMDKIYVYFKDKNGGVREPEYRLPPMIPGTILLPFGLLLSGWAAEKNLHWIATDIGIACVGAGIVLAFQSIQTYVVDSFTLYAASALAVVNCMRSMAGFGFPLFAPAMYDRLGYGKGNTILACLGICIGCPAPFLLWRYGKKIRMGSRYAPDAHRNQQTALSPGRDTLENV